MRLFLSLMMIILPVWPAHALESAVSDAEYVSMKLVSSVSGTGALPDIEAGVHLDLAPGWYTYWRMPGDSGLAPQFDWAASENVKDITVHWPVPERYDTFDMNSFGYKQTVLFPVTIVPETPGKAMDLSLKMNVLVCNEICVPQTVSADLKIPEGRAIETDHADQIDQAFKNLPASEDTKELRLETAVLGKEAVVVTAWSAQGFDKNNTDLFIETENHILTLPPEIMMDESDDQRAIFKIPAPEGIDDLTGELFGENVTVTLTTNGNAVEKNFSF